MLPRVQNPNICYSVVSESEFKSILSTIDRKKFRVEKVEVVGTITWTAIRVRRKGLYRTMTKDSQTTIVGFKDTSGYNCNSNLSALEV